MAPRTTVFAGDKPCIGLTAAGCANPRVPGTSYCRACRAEYLKLYRAKHGTRINLRRKLREALR